ncbi:hypothetical protein Q5P01_015505 [Channa striata]|uniref:Uncharacterized protein n=1 Tax=Channa striata TaxID=64152 RepID=A0AA88MG32_CHASR|nr:hypothetical protein Q5P01_015505 [Channa striata]
MDRKGEEEETDRCRVCGEEKQKGRDRVKLTAAPCASPCGGGGVVVSHALSLRPVAAHFREKQSEVQEPKGLTDDGVCFPSFRAPFFPLDRFRSEQSPSRVHVGHLDLMNQHELH